MFNKPDGKFLVLVLTVSVLIGAYLGFTRYFQEIQDRDLELCVDLDDLKKMAAYEKRPLLPILEALKKNGITAVGVFEETLPDANAMGELFYAGGSGVLNSKELSPIARRLNKNFKILPEATYLYIPKDTVRKRIHNQLKWVVGEKNIKFIGKDILEVNETEKELRDLGLGISESQQNFLAKQGFAIIPRPWNDLRYNAENIEKKIAEFSGTQAIIFDGEDIVGYPDNLLGLAEALKNHEIKYGYVEIGKQFGDQVLKKAMGRQIIRVHSIPKDELKKVTREEAVKRFARAARERKVRMIYLRPFLPPQVTEDLVNYNLSYFSEVRQELEARGFVLGQTEKNYDAQLAGWQVVLMGAGVVVGFIFLANNFIALPLSIMYLILALAVGLLCLAEVSGYQLLLQKSLALLAAITFPALAVISTFQREPSQKATFIVLNVVAESMIGVFLLSGLLTDYRFMLGVESFVGVKIALVLPILIVALYFIKPRNFLNLEVKMSVLILGVGILGVLGILVARSGNFVLPVPQFEKLFRDLLETLFYIRPRTKEFLVGYPFLFLAALSLLRGKKEWLWLFAAVGTIAPISTLNSFSHLHTPISVSMIRTVNGLALGLLAGLVAGAIADKFIKK